MPKAGPKQPTAKPKRKDTRVNRQRADADRDRDGRYPPTTVRFSPEERKKLQALALRYGSRGMSDLLRRLIDAAHRRLPEVL